MVNKKADTHKGKPKVEKKSKSKTDEKVEKKNKKKSKDSNKKTYTLKEVEKHNKKTDAWLVINKNVYDVTKWINLHPGGLVIMKGVGKDATKLFNSIGHSDYAKTMLKKFKIGILLKKN